MASRLLMLTALLLCQLSIDASCVSSRSNPLETYESVQLIPRNFPSGSTAVSTAAAMWNRTDCNDGGDAFQWFQLTSGATRTIRVTYVDGASTTNNICGSFGGNEIAVFTRFRDGASGAEYPCPPGDSGLAATIAHELGHVLGLNDVSSTSCSSFIMSQIRYDSASGTYNARSVQPDECARADAINKTPAETTSPPLDPSDPTVCHNCGATGPEPLILDLDGNGIQLSGLADPVIFDIDGDGILDTTAWTARGSDDAFLILDADGDRFVDGAKELFGSATARHAFEALSRHDWPENGGNEDGVIDQKDRVWAHLRLWIDADHDGSSAPNGEIVTLQSRGIVRLNLEYLELTAEDRYGNRVDYWGTYVRRKGQDTTFWDMYGVTFRFR